ncbi:hypothetical protein ACFQ21_13130 [Ohtaekwangia kribbensis]|jgi:hypothetical protein|uniref:Uncharacterized protein n=1 Tax=Ohtaekwangia kribbensis TaxID=688913 RepID=A0ABW3K2A8_9BACT
MPLFARKINRLLWTYVFESGGNHSLKIYRTPFGTYWILRWRYWTAGLAQFFSMGKLYIRIRIRSKL